MSTPSAPSTNTPLPGAILRRVLVVDDEQIVRNVMRLMLERAGYVVDEAGDATEALIQVQSGESPFVVVVLDFTLPDRDGTDLVPELRQFAPAARIVLTSGRPESDLPSHGADGFLPKPFTKDQLIRAVQHVTAASGG